MHTEVIGQTEFTFKIAESKQLLKEAYRLRYQVYSEECGFIKQEDYPDELESDKYDPCSIHFVAEDRYGLIGTARLVLDNPDKFPIEEHCRNNLTFDMSKLNRKKTAEISRLVITKRYRRRRDDGLYYGRSYQDQKKDSAKEIIKRIRPMAFGIYREIYQECRRRDITHWFALMEKTLWHLLKMHNFAFQPIGEEIDFYGAVRPYICKIEDVEKEVAQKSPRFLEYFLDGLEPEYQPKLPQRQPA